MRLQFQLLIILAAIKVHVYAPPIQITTMSLLASSRLELNCPKLAWINGTVASRVPNQLALQDHRDTFLATLIT